MTNSSRKYIVKTLKLVNFRNLVDHCFEFNDYVVMVNGNNGAGKSNLLEAISMLYPGSGMRMSTASDIISFGKDSWAILSIVNDSVMSKHIDTTYINEKKQIKINSKPIEKMAELAENIAISWLSPEIIHNYSSDLKFRRTFFDRIVYSFDFNHATKLNSYAKMLTERSKMLRTGLYDSLWLNTIENHIVDLMCHVFVSRGTILAMLNDVLSVNGLELKHNNAVNLDKDYLLEKIRNSRNIDRIRGGLTFGPHKTKFQPFKNGLGFDFCSSGSKKDIMIDILLAQVELNIKTRNHYPIILLDDILEQLDRNTKKAVLDQVMDIGCQVFITTCNELTDMKDRLFTMHLCG